MNLRGAGLSGKAEGTYSTDLFADDVAAAFMHADGIPSAHVSRPLPRRRDRHAAGGEAPVAGAVPFAAQRLAGELVIFEGCSHAPACENVAEFNARTVDFLIRNS